VLRNENDMVLLYERLIISKTKGERGGQRERVYHARSYFNGKTGKRVTRREVVSRPSEIRRLKQELRVEDEEISTIKNRPMRDMLLAIGMAVFSGRNERPKGIEPKHWRHNIHLAKTQLRERGLKRDQRSLGEICIAIIPPPKVKSRVRQFLCKTCHTPLLIGYYVEGHKITWKKKFCSNACRTMKARRGPS